MMISQAIVDRARQPIGETGALIAMNISAPLAEDGLIPVALTATAEAVATALPFLDAQMVMNPAKGTIDGSMYAKYLVVFLVVTVFEVPKKRLHALKVMDRHNIRNCCRAVEYRLQDNPAFFKWLTAIAAEAVANFNEVTADA